MYQLLASNNVIFYSCASTVNTCNAETQRSKLGTESKTPFIIPDENMLLKPP